MQNIKTYLFENCKLASEQIYNWVNSFDNHYKEINTEPHNYDRSDDLHFFGLLINPELERICTSSGFSTIMGFDAEQSFRKQYDDSDKQFMQLEYFTWLIYEAMYFRTRNKMKSLTLEINYYGNDFIKDVNDGDLGEDVKMYLKLIFRQFEGAITLNIYNEFKLYKTILSEDDLNFN